MAAPDDGQPHPSESVAADIKTLFARASTIIDLNRYHSDSQLDIASMPDDIAKDVEDSYQEHRARLGGK